MTDEHELEAFINESIRHSKARGYFPTKFIEMRSRWGTKEAIKRLVVSGDIRSGFRRAHDLGLLDWTIEAATLKFPALFDKAIREAAQFRLEQAGWKR